MDGSLSHAPLILVLGMHRSGTSALTRAIALGGAALPRTMLEPRADNEGGYWESARLVALDELALRSMGTNALAAWTPAIEARWHALAATLVPQLERAYRREFDGSAPSVAKDPRMCLLAKAHVAAGRASGRRVVAVLLVRDPAATARSLAARNGIAVAYADLLWRQHVLLAERDTRDVPRMILRYDEFVADPVTAVDRVLALAGCARPSAAEHIRAWVTSNRVQRAGQASAESEEVLRLMGARALDAARLDDLLQVAIKAGDSADPECPLPWLDLQAEVTIASAQVAALVSERCECAGAPERIARTLVDLDLRLADEGRVAQAEARA